MWLKISAFSADFAVRFCVRNQEYTISFCGCTILKSNYILCGRVLLTSVSCVEIKNSSFLPFKSLHPHQESGYFSHFFLFLQQIFPIRLVRSLLHFYAEVTKRNYYINFKALLKKQGFCFVLFVYIFLYYFLISHSFFRMAN